MIMVLYNWEAIFFAKPNWLAQIFDRKIRCPKSYVKLSKIRLSLIGLGIRKSHDTLKLDDCY